jgi:DNA polymerase III psi subunit
MNIEKEYLPFIFADDVIYLVASDHAVGEMKVIAAQAADEQLSDEPIVVEEPQLQEIKLSTFILLDSTPTDKEKTLLDNILKAVGIEPSTVKTLDQHPDKFTELKGAYLFLSFAASYSPKGAYDMITLNGIKVIYAHTLSDLDKNIAYKKDLWSNLKKIA